MVATILKLSELLNDERKKKGRRNTARLFQKSTLQQITVTVIEKPEC